MPTLAPFVVHPLWCTLSPPKWVTLAWWLQMEGPGGVQEAIKLTLQQASGIPMLCMPRA